MEKIANSANRKSIFTHQLSFYTLHMQLICQYFALQNFFSVAMILKFLWRFHDNLDALSLYLKFGLCCNIQ